MTDGERRDILLDVIKEFTSISELHKAAVQKLEASAIPSAQRFLIIAALGMAEKAMRKASIILLSWSIGAYDSSGSSAGNESHRH